MLKKILVTLSLITMICLPTIYGNCDHSPVIKRANFYPLYRNYQIFPNFCHHHVKSDPLGCSSSILNWGPKPIHFEAEEEGRRRWLKNKYFRIDKALVDQTADKLFLIPYEEGSHCEYGECSRCNSVLKRVDHWSSAEPNRFSLAYSCDCTTSPIRLENMSPWEFAYTENWTFCEQPAIYALYFSKYTSPYFNDFLNYLEYCEKNSACNCYWPEKSEAISEILDEIFLVFAIPDRTISRENFSPENLRDPAQGIWPSRILERYGEIIPYFSHSFWYSQLKKSLPNMCCYLYPKEVSTEDECGCNDSRRECEADVKKTLFINNLMRKLQPKFLKLYNECYALHPSPEIAREIELLMNDMPQD